MSGYNLRILTKLKVTHMKKNITGTSNADLNTVSTKAKTSRTKRVRSRQSVKKDAPAIAEENKTTTTEENRLTEGEVDTTSQEKNTNEMKDSTKDDEKKLDSKKIKYRIFQIYYEPWQKDLLEPSFAKFDNSQSQSDLYEFEVFTKLVTSEYTKEVAYWGALSWKFKEKTLLSAESLIRSMDAAPGYDVYIMNPNPEIEALYPSVWMQGAVSHRNFMALCEAFFKAAGLPLEKLVEMQSDRYFMTANYFIGNHRFWKAYMLWMSKVLMQSNKNLSDSIKQILRSTLADDRDLHGGATYMPFIIERLLGLFLQLHPEIRSFNISLDQRIQKMNVHLRVLREMRSIAVKSQSKWLTSCWINYRNLYLSRTKGNDWCKEFIPKITPKEIIF